MVTVTLKENEGFICNYNSDYGNESVEVSFLKKREKGADFVLSYVNGPPVFANYESRYYLERFPDTFFIPHKGSRNVENRKIKVSIVAPRYIHITRVSLEETAKQ